jgi:hypothetical protein
MPNFFFVFRSFSIKLLKNAMLHLQEYAKYCLQILYFTNFSKEKYAK